MSLIPDGLAISLVTPLSRGEMPGAGSLVEFTYDGGGNGTIGQVWRMTLTEALLPVNRDKRKYLVSPCTVEGEGAEDIRVVFYADATNGMVRFGELFGIPLRLKSFDEWIKSHE